MFPNNAITKTINVPDTGGTFCPELLSASENTRTLLQAVIITDGANQGKVKIGTNEYLDNLRNNFIGLITPIEFTNQTITCERANNKPFQFTITYVNYSLSGGDSGVGGTGQQLIQNTETGTMFRINESFTYGEATIIIFLTIFTFCIIGKIVYNFIFKNVDY